MADIRVAVSGGVYFVGPGALFSRVALRTVETELDSPTRRVPDLDALRAARLNEAGVAVPAYMVVVHESAAAGLLAALARGADYLPDRRLSIAFERDDSARALRAEFGEALVRWRVSLLPMNANVTIWVRLLQVIQAGGHYMPPAVLRPPEGAGAEPEGAGCAGPEVIDRDEVHEALTPREAEVLAMAADGSPNKIIAARMELSEHTVKLYMHRIIGKLGAKNRTEAAAWYHQHAGHG